MYLLKVNKIALSAKDDKRRKSIDYKETDTYKASDNIMRRKEEIKYSNIIKQNVFSFDGRKHKRIQFKLTSSS